MQFELDRHVDLEPGEQVSVFIQEVGFIAGQVARRNDQLLAVRFDLPQSVERDLLIRKLLTAGYDTKSVSASAWSTTRDMVRSIWQMRSDMQEITASEPEIATKAPLERLPAQSLVVPPRPERLPLAELVESRRDIAA